MDTNSMTRVLQQVTSDGDASVTPLLKSRRHSGATTLYAEQCPGRVVKTSIPWHPSIKPREYDCKEYLDPGFGPVIEFINKIKRTKGVSEEI